MFDEYDTKTGKWTAQDKKTGMKVVIDMDDKLSYSCCDKYKVVGIGYQDIDDYELENPI